MTPQRLAPNASDYPTITRRTGLLEALPLPLCVLPDATPQRHIARFQRYAEDSGVLLSPPAKTTMSPALFGRQLAAGCWGLTFANCAQLEVARRHGVPRVFYANQLVGAADIRYVCDELRRDPGFDFYCLVDSVPGVRLLAARVADAAPARPVSVLVEAGLKAAPAGGATSGPPSGAPKPGSPPGPPRPPPWPTASRGLLRTPR